MFDSALFLLLSVSSLFIQLLCRQEFLEIMEILDKRLNDKGKNWRHVFKVRLYQRRTKTNNILFLQSTLQEYDQRQETTKKKRPHHTTPPFPRFFFLSWPIGQVNMANMVWMRRKGGERVCSESKEYQENTSSVLLSVLLLYNNDSLCAFSHVY